MLNAAATRLRAATDTHRPWQHTQLLHFGRSSAVPSIGNVRDLEALVRAGDVLVLNDAATLPASLIGRYRGRPIELRLATTLSLAAFPANWTAVLFGDGDWRTDTDRRPVPPLLSAGDLLEFGALRATVQVRHRRSSRLLKVQFNEHGDRLADLLYEVGTPVQYSHLHHPLALHHVQTPYASRPWAIEMPSTGRPLRWSLLNALQERGIELAWLTEAAGLSATGDTRLDAGLPLPERYEIPAATADMIAKAKRRGGRVIAVGTTVVRALEASRAKAGFGIAANRIGKHSELQIVDGLITGIHSPGESHWQLLSAFASESMLGHARSPSGPRSRTAHPRVR